MVQFFDWAQISGFSHGWKPPKSQNLWKYFSRKILNNGHPFLPKWPLKMGRGFETPVAQHPSEPNLSTPSWDESQINMDSHNTKITQMYILHTSYILRHIFHYVLLTPHAMACHSSVYHRDHNGKITVRHIYASTVKCHNVYKCHVAIDTGFK